MCEMIVWNGTLVLTGRFIETDCQILALLTNNEEKLIGVKGDCRQILSICDVCAQESCDYTSIQFKLTIMQTCVYVSNSCNAAESKLICFRELGGGWREGGVLTARLLVP